LLFLEQLILLSRILKGGGSQTSWNDAIVFGSRQTLIPSLTFFFIEINATLYTRTYISAIDWLALSAIRKQRENVQIFKLKLFHGVHLATNVGDIRSISCLTSGLRIMTVAYGRRDYMRAKIIIWASLGNQSPSLLIASHLPGWEPLL
jgi:hypothetical protein